MRTRSVVLLTLGLLALVAGVTLIVRRAQDREWDAELARLTPLLEADFREFESRPQDRQPVFGPPIDTTAWSEYEAASDLWDAAPDEWIDDDEWPWADWTSGFELEPIPDEIRSHPPPLEPMLAVLLRAADAERIGDPPDHRTGHFGDDIYRRISQASHLRQLIECATVLRHDAGDTAGALDLLFVLERLGTDLARDAELTSRIVGTACRTSTMTEIAAWISRAKVPSGEFHRIETLGRRVLFEPLPDVGVIEPDWLLAQSSLRRAAAGEEELFPDVKLLSTATNLLMDFLEPSRGDLLEAWRRTRELREGIAIAPPADAPAWTALGGRIRRETADSGNTALQFMGDHMSRACQMVPTLFEQRRVAAEKLLLSVALARHVAEHGSPPETIDAILPEGVRSAPPAGPWSLWTDRKTGGALVGIGSQREAEAREAEADRRNAEMAEDLLEMLED